MTQLFSTEPATYTVVEISTGKRITCASLEAMMAMKSRLELASRPAAKDGVKMAARELKRQAGVR